MPDTILEAAPAPGLPPLYCPFELARSPYTDSVGSEAIAWMDHFGFCDSAERRDWTLKTNTPEFFGRCAARAGHPERFLKAVCFTYLAFTLDDHCETAYAHGGAGQFAELAGRIMTAIEWPDYQLPAGADPFVAAAHDVAAFFHRDCTPTQVTRWIHEVRKLLFGALWHLSNHRRGVLPRPDDYLAMRIQDAGGGMVLTLMELVNGDEIPEAEKDSPAVRAATEATSGTAALDNDLVSREKGLLEPTGDQDMINVLCAAHGCSPEEALSRTVAVRDRTSALLLRLREQLMPHASDPLRAYLTGLGHVVRGNLEWSFDVHRYHFMRESGPPSRAGDGARPGWAEHPSDPSPGPLPYPSVAWWWKQLAPDRT
ncbi:terpene synthase family protein [Streptomyces daliensis]|uniref:Terpene synthase n=1 Tax=Streptomyces daliensis TaxID=299421 RepID=A0A8T4IX80_9ACTN|nr:hypothetical protein [Streptomyces daliensis]